ncbi:MAG: hypothetical protein ABJP48_13600 [Erythrobacter sp.]
MSNQNQAIRIEYDAARAGATTGAMRWVLGVSLTAAIVSMTLVWVIPALSA